MRASIKFYCHLVFLVYIFDVVCIPYFHLLTGSPSNDLGPVTSWTVKEVLKWLQSIKLGKYTDMFEREEIDGEELAEYDHECLRRLE